MFERHVNARSDWSEQTALIKLKKLAGAQEKRLKVTNPAGETEAGSEPCQGWATGLCYMNMKRA
jgi:hypothetical protein